MDFSATITHHRDRRIYSLKLKNDLYVVFATYGEDFEELETIARYYITGHWPTDYTPVWSRS